MQVFGNVGTQVVALHSDGVSVEEIGSLMNQKNVHIERYIGHFERGRSKAVRLS